MEERASCPPLQGARPAEVTPILATVRDFRVPRQAARPGQRLVAGYEILQQLGQGGMGVVYLARQVQLDRLVALKMIRSARADREELLRFRTEAESVARLTHANIVQIYEIGEHEGQPFFSLEFCPGGSLDRRLNGQPVAPPVAAALVEKLARAVDYAHQRGVVHRDLKPANVLLQTDDSGSQIGRTPAPGGAPLSTTGEWQLTVPKVTDFGLAKRVDVPGQTRAGMIMGTPAYMAPEQANGQNEVIGPPCDVYALGAILYECLTGRPPFVGGDLFRTLDQVCHDDPVPPRSLVAGLPPDLETIALKCLRKEQGRRYPTAADLADDLRRFLAGEPITARPVGRAERAVKWARRRPYQAALAAVLLLFVASALVAGPLRVRSLRHEARLAKMQATQAETLASYQLRFADGEAAFSDRDNLGAARDHFASVVEKITDEDADEDPRLADLREQAVRKLKAVKKRLRDAERLAKAQKKAADFWKQRDEAFFWLHREAVAGADPRGPANAARAARRALASFPDVDCLPETRAKLRLARQEVRFLLAEAASRDGNGEQQHREALRLLNEADELARKEGFTLRSARARRARYLHQLGRHEEALREQKLAAQIRPAGVLDHFLTGQDRWWAGDTAGALASFENALREQPDLFWGLFFRALALQKLRRDREALIVLEQCIDARPNLDWLYLVRGFVYARQKNFVRATEDFDDAERLGPDDAVRYAILANRGVVALELNHPDRAINLLTRATQLMPDHYHAYTLLSQAHSMRGDRRNAMRAFDRAIELDPSRPGLYRARAGLHRKRGDPAAALRDLDRAVKLQANDHPTADLAGDQRDRAHLLYGLGRYKEALAAARRSLAINLAIARKDAAVARIEAEALLELGKHKDALAAFDHFLTIGKPDADLYRRRARARAALGGVAGVIDEHTAALALKPADKRDRSDAPLLAARGWAYLVTAAPAAALRDFQAALTLDPKSGEALVGRGAARLDLNQPRAALADVDEGLKLGPRSSRLLYNAARVIARAAARLDEPRQQRKDNERAAALLGEAVKALPEAQRGRFWREQVRRDGAFRPLARQADFARLTRLYQSDEEA